MRTVLWGVALLLPARGYSAQSAGIAPPQVLSHFARVSIDEPPAYRPNSAMEIVPEPVTLAIAGAGLLGLGLLLRRRKK